MTGRADSERTRAGCSKAVSTKGPSTFTAKISSYPSTVRRQFLLVYMTPPMWNGSSIGSPRFATVVAKASNVRR